MIIKVKKTGFYSIDNLPLFISIWYWNNDKYDYAHIQTRDMQGKQDAKIGNFSENWYCRPSKALKMIPYKTLKDYKIACILSIKHILPDIKIDCFSIDKDDNTDYDTYQEVI